MKYAYGLSLSALILGVILFAHPALASGWAERDSPTSNTLFGIDVSSSTVYAVGENGAVVYSEDGGDSLNDGDGNTSYDLYDVSAISSTKAVAVGEHGTVARTSDSGANWSEITPTYLNSSHGDYALRAVNMVSSTVGYAVGQYGIMLETTDGGASWNEIDSPTSESLNSIGNYGTSKVWVAGESGVIFYSSNGGSSWSTETSGTAENLVTITFVDSSHGFASGDSRTFLYTSDGGGTWSSRTVSDLASGDTVDDVSFLNSSDGILSSNAGDFLVTTDGGVSWDNVDASGSPVLIDLSYVSSSERWGVGQDGAFYAYDSSVPAKPTNFDVAGNNGAVTDTTPTFSWSASTDDSGIDYYEFKMDSNSYADIGDTTSKTYSTALSSGSHTAYLYAVDLGGNASSVASVAFTVDADSTSSSAPDVSTITPTTAVTGQTVTYSVRVSDDGSLSSCKLYLDGSEAKSMTMQTDVAYATESFSTSASHTMYARCTDDAGNKTSGTEVTVTVSPTSSYVSPGNIIKIGCTGDVYVNDPCTAVYYYGKDGNRHAFPNEDVFLDWFSNYDDLVTLTSTAMADIPLGRNVTYRPGETLVKFSTNSVYAISYLGVLRPIADASIAEAIFGSGWVSQITIVNDVFYGNYRYGTTIESSNDYSASSAKSVTSSIDATF